MKLKRLFLMLAFSCIINTVSADKLIAENPLVAVRIKSYNKFIGIVPQLMQMQVAAVEKQFPFLDKTKEAVVVMTSIMPPVAYAAIPVKAGTQMDTVNQALPPDLQAKAQIRDDYLYLPFSGELPQNIGKGKLPANKSTVQVNINIEMINKLNGPMIAALMEQDFSQMLPAQNEQDASMMKATVEFYKVLLLDLLKSSTTVDLKIDKTDAYKIDVKAEFTPESKWAAICKSHSSFTIPETDSIKEGPMYFAGVFDYSTMKPFMKPFKKYMDSLGEAMGSKGMGEMMESFSKIGITKTIGSFGMNDNSMKMDYLMEGSQNADMTAVLNSMKSYMSDENELLTMKKLDETVNGQTVYRYSMKQIAEEMMNVDAYIMAKGNGLYYASKIEDLSKYSSAKIKEGTKKGFMWMKMDMNSFAKGMALPAPEMKMPIIEFLSSSTDTGMRSIITVK